jgi:uncharacterized membrane protein
MGKKAKARRETTATAKPTQQRHSMRSSPNWPLLVLSGLGILLTSYLSYTSFKGMSVKGCGVGSSCDVVLTSQWSELFGLPTATWGLLTYITLAATSFIKREDTHWKSAWLISMFGLLFSLYLTTVSLTVLDAACPYCLTSLTLMAAIFGLVSWQRPAHISQPWGRWIAKSVPVGIAAIFVLHLYYAGFLGEAPGPEDPTARALAEHLTKSGAKMYGAYWCPHCQQQKAIFGRSANRLPYIECSPGGRTAPQADECRSANINTYPTWIINGKRTEEVMDFKQLSDASGFNLGQSRSSN